MKRKFRTLAGSVAVAGLVLSGAVAASTASAETINLVDWVEGENGHALKVVDGLVFFAGAQINFGTSEPGPNPAPFAAVDAIAGLDEIDGLAYTVAESTSYAPSFQLVIAADAADPGPVTYARLVFEPYQQEPGQGPDTGEFTDLEDGLWWGNRVFVNGAGSSPFGSGDGSQSSPQPLSFFADYFGESAEVKAISVQQGTTSNITSVVTSLEVEGKRIDLGHADETPYTQADIDAAKAKVPADVQAALDAANAKVTELEAALAAAQSEISELKNDVAAAEEAAAKASDKVLKARAGAAVTLAGKAKVGKTLRVKTASFKGIKVKYTWYVGGKKVAKAKKSTLKLKKSFAKKPVKVVVTKSYKSSTGKTVKVKTTVKATKNAKVAR